MQTTIKVKSYVYHARISVMQEEGLDVGDDGREADNLLALGQSEWILSRLTRRQRQVAELLGQGYTRRETADRLGICLQAIHQIVPRMRRRLALQGMGGTETRYMAGGMVQ